MKCSGKSPYGKITMAGISMVMLGGSYLVADTASAAPQPKEAIVTVSVSECPKIENHKAQTVPTPAFVIVLRHGETYKSTSVAFAKKSFLGRAQIPLPAGTYQLVSSYEGPVLTVKVASGSHRTTSFGSPSCVV
jgi:hypothetical protein